VRLRLSDSGTVLFETGRVRAPAREPAELEVTPKGPPIGGPRETLLLGAWPREEPDEETEHRHE